MADPVPQLVARPPQAPYSKDGGLVVPPVKHKTVYLADEKAAEDFVAERVNERIAALKLLETSGLFVQRKEYLRQEEGLRIGSKGIGFYVVPDKDRTAANFSFKKFGEDGLGIVAMMPGIPTSGHQGLVDYSDETVTLTGRPTFVIPNDEHNAFGDSVRPRPLVNFLRSITNSIAGLRNAEWGARREPSTLELAKLLIYCTEAGIPVTVIGHSQGTINAANAFLLLKKEMPKEVYQKICDNCRLYAIGAAQVMIPEGVDGRVWIKDGDIVCTGGKLAARIKEDPINPKVREPNLKLIPERIVEVKGSDHSFGSYVERADEFFIRGAIDRDFTKENGKVLARHVISAIARAEFSEEVMHSILKAVSDISSVRDRDGSFRHQGFYSAFSRELTDAARAGTLGNFSLSRNERRFFRVDE